MILSYMANTSRTHACTHAHTHIHTQMHTHTCTHAQTRTREQAHPPTAVTVEVVAVTRAVCAQSSRRCALFSPVPLAMNGRSVLYCNKQSRVRGGIRDSFGCFSRLKQILGRTETPIRDRMYCRTIRTVRDISRDDRARIVSCSLRTPTDRENYSID